MKTEDNIHGLLTQTLYLTTIYESFTTYYELFSTYRIILENHLTHNTLPKTRNIVIKELVKFIKDDKRQTKPFRDATLEIIRKFMSDNGILIRDINLK